MKNTYTSLALVGLLSFSTQLFAQQVDLNKLDQEAAQAQTRVLKEVLYDELPLGEIVQDLRKQFPEMNFLVDEDVEDVTIRLDMRNVTLPNILEALGIAAKKQHLLVDQPGARLITFALDQGAIEEEIAVSKKPVMRAFNLSGYFNDAAPAEVDALHIQLIELLAETARLYNQASGTAELMEMPDFKLHTGTRMLIAVGNEESINILEEIVYSLPGMERPQRSSTR